VELSSVLGHIEKIGELTLDDVAPTSHVVEVGNALREDVPVECLPRDLALDQAPAVQDGGFLVPSPQAGGPTA
jgi:aspartyl-tRNA(Asn)/glutamyl-tRNA(Gln) amidotransferase subunit C